MLSAVPSDHFAFGSKSLSRVDSPLVGFAQRCLWRGDSLFQAITREIGNLNLSGVESE